MTLSEICQIRYHTLEECIKGARKLTRQQCEFYQQGDGKYLHIPRVGTDAVATVLEVVAGLKLVTQQGK